MIRLPLPTKRMLSDQEAADYCGFTSVDTFLARVRGRVAPVNYGRFVRYDVHLLDAWLDTLSESGASDGMGIIEAAGNEDRARARA